MNRTLVLGRRFAILLVPLLLAGGVGPAAAGAGTTELVSVSSDGAPANGSSILPVLSGDGRFVAFSSDASNLVAADTNGASDVFVRDLIAGTTERVSLGSGGQQGNDASGGVFNAISSDGRFVAFSSLASNLVVGDVNGSADVFVRDRLLGTTERVSVGDTGQSANGANSGPAISPDGRYVAFTSEASDLVPGDSNTSADVFVRDRIADTTERVSVASSGQEGNGDSIPYHTSISADGRFVAFTSYSSNLVAADTNSSSDVFVRDRLTATTQLVSVSSVGLAANEDSISVSISADGRYVSFWSWASNLVTPETAPGQVFVRDLVADATELVSLNSGGQESNNISAGGWLSSDGRYVAFESDATNLVAGDTNNAGDVFLRDRTAGTTERVNVSSTGAEGNSNSFVGSLSSDGQLVAFESDASNLVAGDTNDAADVFVRDRGAAPPVGVCAGRPATINGSQGADTLLGTPGSDVIVALGGHDTISGRGGDDVICGGPGDDVIRGGAGDDRIHAGRDADHVVGGRGNDHIFGYLGDDVLSGAAGGDLLLGGRGDDVLDGGADQDRCWGGRGFNEAINCEQMIGVP